MQRMFSLKDGTGRLIDSAYFSSFRGVTPRLTYVYSANGEEDNLEKDFFDNVNYP